MLNRLLIAKLFINLKKYIFNIDIIKFLGFIITFKGILIEKSRVDAITK